MRALPRSVLFVLLLAAVAIAAWFAWPDDEAPPAEMAAGEPHASALPSGTAERADATSGADATMREVVPVDEAAAGVDIAQSVRIHVVDGAGSPVADAEIGVYVAVAGEDVLAADAAEELAWDGTTYRADASGQLSLPIAREDVGWTIYGRRDELWGVRFVPASMKGERIELVLHVDLTIRARVRDPDGEPVGDVRVGLCDETGVEDGRNATFRRTSPADGVVTFRHAQRYVREDWGSDAALMLACPTPVPVFARIDLQALPADPIELRLPATGSVRIRLVDADGRAHEGLQETVYARMYQVDEKGERHHWLTFRGDRVELGHVGLGLRLRVELESSELRGLLEFDGPSRQGEHVEQQLVASRQPTLAGRLVDEHGEPLRGYWFATYLRDAPGLYNQYFETGDDGRFEAPVPSMGEGASRRGVLFHRTVTGSAQQAWRDFASLGLHDGRNELGDVVLQPAPVLVSGRVIDDTGHAIANAKVAVLQGTTERAWGLPGYRESELETDEAGRFEVRAYSLLSDLLLQASVGENRGELVSFVAGATGIEYVLPRVGEVWMPLRFVGGMTADRAVFTRIDRATQQGKGYVADYVYEDGVVRWQGIPPGRYDFTVRVLGFPAPLVAIHDVAVLGGQRHTLPPQQVGDGLEKLRVEVVDASDRPVPGASVVVNPADGTGAPRCALPVTLGAVEVWVPERPVDLLVLAPGCRSRTVYGVARDTKVQLDPGLSVELTVQLPAGLLAADETLRPLVRRFDAANPDPKPWERGHDLFLRGAGRRYYPEAHSWLWANKQTLGRDGKLQFRVPSAGTYSVDWEVHGATWRQLPPAARRVFTVPEGTSPVRVTWTLSAEDVR